MPRLLTTLVRLCGALLLAATATWLDRPRPPATAVPVVVASELQVRQEPARQQPLRVRPGMRALAVPVLVPRELGQRLVPFTVVDLLPVPRSDADSRSADPVAVGLRVLEVRADPRRTAPPGLDVYVGLDSYIVVVEVTPEIARRVAVAGEQGPLGLTIPSGSVQERPR